MKISASHTGESSASIAAASLSSRIETTAISGRRSPTTSGSDSTSAAIPSGLCAPSTSVSGSPPITWSRPGTRTAAAAAATASSSQLAQICLGGCAREREVAALIGAGRADGNAGVGRRLDDPGATLGRHRLGHRDPRHRASACPSTSVAPR